MVFKRGFGEEEEEGFKVGNQEGKRRIVSSNFAQNVLCELSSQQLSTLEPLIRRWVREEVQRACQNVFCALPRSPLNAFEEPCKKTSLQLRFQANLPNTLFANSRIESEDNTPVKVVLFDINSNKIVSSGPFSTLKLEIVSLDGDFCADDEEDWSEKEFDAKVIHARDGRRPLIIGDLVVTLENGVAELRELCFTDNSSWRRSRKFMIGARVKDASSGVRIREAKSQAFIVKDHRGESYKKHHPPYLGDEIWRLEKIAKDGVFHKRLASHNISTVKDFLQMYATNQSLLRKVLGGSSNKTWETIIKHANTCVLDDKLYIYRSDIDRIGLLLDSVLTVVGATFDGQNYLTLDKLPMFQMNMVESSKQKLYRNLDGWVPMDDPTVSGALLPMPISNPHIDSLKSVGFGLQGVTIPVLHQDEHIYGEVDSNTKMEADVGYDPFSTEYFSPNDFGIKESSNGGAFDYQTGTSLWQGNELIIDTDNQIIDIFSSDFGFCFSRNGSPRGQWCKIRAALKWGSVRRNVATKRMALLDSYLDFSV